MEKTFRAISILLAIGLVLSAAAHTVLLSSDSHEYRRWVMILMLLQLLAAGFVLMAGRFKPAALVGLVAVAVPFLYINAVFVNSGSVGIQLVTATLGIAAYSALAFSVRHRFRTHGERSVS
jgi:hypothetical protein